MTIEEQLRHLGYLQSSARKWSFRGDRDSWAKIVQLNDKRILTMHRALRGTISSDYESFLTAVGQQVGIDWAAIPSGDNGEVILLEGIEGK